MPKGEKLNERQQRFVEEYLRAPDSLAKAYLRAGFKQQSEDNASIHAAKLLKNPLVQKAIAEFRQGVIERTQVTVDWVVGQLKENVLRAMTAVPVLDSEGNATGVYTYQGQVANAALKQLGDYLGMDNNKKESTVKIESQVEHRLAMDKLDVPLEVLLAALEYRQRKEVELLECKPPENSV